MRRGEALADCAGERSECADDGWAGAGPVAGVDCCDCGRKRGLAGATAAVGACWEAAMWERWATRWAGVELEGGAPESGMGTSEDEATARGACEAADDEGRAGVCDTAGES